MPLTSGASGDAGVRSILDSIPRRSRGDRRTPPVAEPQPPVRGRPPPAGEPPRRAGVDWDTKAHGDPDAGIRGPRQRQGGQTDHGEQSQEAHKLVCVLHGWYPSVVSFQKNKRNQGRYSCMAMYGGTHAPIHAW